MLIHFPSSSKRFIRLLELAQYFCSLLLRFHRASPSISLNKKTNKFFHLFSCYYEEYILLLIMSIGKLRIKFNTFLDCFTPAKIPHMHYILNCNINRTEKAIISIKLRNNGFTLVLCLSHFMYFSN